MGETSIDDNKLSMRRQHPAHTYYPQQNSKVLGLVDTYSLTFNAPGIYPYYCSAHASTMTGEIVVEGQAI